MAKGTAMAGDTKIVLPAGSRQVRWTVVKVDLMPGIEALSWQWKGRLRWMEKGNVTGS